MRGRMHWMFRGDVDTRSVKKLTWATVVRVLRYSRPYWGVLTGGLFLILIQTGINLVQPLLFRELIDNALPNRNVELINVLALGLVFIPIIDNIVGIAVRYLNSKVGEGVIYDLRRNLYAHLQRMSLRFFTHTQGGELISRLNSDVINAQGAISDTLVGSVTQGINLIATLIIMLALEWRLTLLGLLVFPFFYLLARFVGVKLRAITRESMELNAQMNAMMNETLNIGGALLVKLFGQHKVETNRFERRAARVRDIGIKRAVFSSQFWAMMGLIGVVGSGLVYFIGSYLFLSNIFTIGTIVAFSGYLSRLYGPLQYLINVPVQFATSVVSFERVFEVIDLPLDIAEKPDAHVLKDSRGELVTPMVTGDGAARGSIAVGPTPALVASPTPIPGFAPLNPTTPPNLPAVDNRAGNGAPALTNVAFSSSVGVDDCPISPTTTFSGSASSIYVSAVGQMLTSSNVVSSRWLLDGVEQVIYTWSPSALVDGACIWFYITPEGVPFTPGSWSVELTIDGATVSTSGFTIEGDAMSDGS